MTEQYPPENAKSNYADLLSLHLFREREFVCDKYMQQGYLGRFLMYLIDKIVQASLTSF